MRTLLRLLFFVACIGLLGGCEKEENSLESGADLKSANLSSDKEDGVKSVTVPFKADFVGEYLEGSGPNTECGDCPVDEEGVPIGPECWGLVFNDGEGTATHLGKFTHHFEFCIELISGIYPGPTGHMEAWFIAANGDTLFVDVSGVVVNDRLAHHPEDVNSYFADPWTITGGTGRFEGATGGGMTDDYNRDAYPANSFHHWRGTISLVKGENEKHRKHHKLRK